MSFLNRCLVIFIPLIMIISCGSGSTGMQDVSQGLSGREVLNINNIPSQYSASLYSLPPESMCAGEQIWREESLTPPVSPCELGTGGHAQVANGCNVTTNTGPGLGPMLARSVAGVFIPYSNGTSQLIWDLGCSGTVIGNQWVITAAHCLTNPNLAFQPLYIALWQTKYDGLPSQFDMESAIEKYKVAAIYIPNGYSVESRPDNASYQGYMKEDYALLKLESVLPDKYVAIALESVQQFFLPETQTWFAGYGSNQSQVIDGRLHYRAGYYQSNIYDDQLYGGTTVANLGQIYTTGSKPEMYNGLMSAWSFIGHGDSGGPTLYWNSAADKFYLLGDLSVLLNDCYWTGIFAPLRSATEASTSVQHYYESITAVMNGTAAVSATKCLSASRQCTKEKAVYIVNQGSNSISVYNIKMNNQLVYSSTIATGSTPTSLAITSGALLVSNANSISSGTISQYFVNNTDGQLMPANPPQFMVLANPVEIFTDDNGINTGAFFTVNQGSDSISRFQNESDVHPIIIPTGQQPSSMDSVQLYNNTLDNFIYVTNYADDSVSIYKRERAPDRFVQLPVRIPTGSGPSEIKIIVDYAYVLNKKDSTISVYKIEESSGYLIPLANTPENPNPTLQNDLLNPSHMIIASPYAYISNSGSNTVSQYKIKNKGYLSYMRSYVSGASPAGMALDSKRQTLYVTNSGDNTVTQFSLDKDSKCPSDLAQCLSYRSTIKTGENPVAVAIK